MQKERKEYYRCIHPDCTHIVHRDLVRGKRATCICGQEFFMTPASMQLKNPHCEDCTKAKVGKIKINAELLEKIQARSASQKEFDYELEGEI